MSKYLQNVGEYIDWAKKEIYLDSMANRAKSRAVQRGYVYWCEFGINIGSEQEERRPCVILQHQPGNVNSPNTIVAPITHTKSVLDTVVPISDKYDANGTLILDGFVLLGNIVTVSKARLGNQITQLSSDEMDDIDVALSKATGLFTKFSKYERIIADKDVYINKLKSKIEAQRREIERLSDKNGKSDKE